MYLQQTLPLVDLFTNSTSQSSMSNPITPSIILRHTSSYLQQVLTQPDLRHQIISSARLKLPSPLDPTLLQSLSLITQSVTNSINIVKLASTIQNPTPLSCLLLSIAYTHLSKHVTACFSLLDVFILDPSFARSELALPVFENLFIPHLLPAVQWFSERRSSVFMKCSNEGVDDEEEEEEEMGSVVFETMSVLSRMSGGQTEELRELERGFEDVMDENCRVYAHFLKKLVLGGSNGLTVPKLVFSTRDGEFSEVEDDQRSVAGMGGGQYTNPMWTEDDGSYDSSHSNKRQYITNKKARDSYPQRVSASFIRRKQINKNGTRKSNNVLPPDSSFSESEKNSEETSFEYKSGTKVKTATDNNIDSAFFLNSQGTKHGQEATSIEFECFSNTTTMDSDYFMESVKRSAPKDFVCSITSNIFNDPVTLETGQTYERKAIQEWLDRGNTTCPITRQSLSSTQLPKTNYVLKRLIASWLEQNPYSTPISSISSQSPSPPPLSSNSSKPCPSRTPSPTSVISQASLQLTTSDLRNVISQLCTSELLEESETAVMQIERAWREYSSSEPGIISALSKPAVVNGFVEILFNSVNPQILGATVFLLSELALKESSVVQTLTRVDSDVDCMVALFKKGLPEAVVLIYLLTPSWENLMEMDMVDSLVASISRKEEEDVDVYDMCIKPRTASLLLLWQIMRGDDVTGSSVANILISDRTVECVVMSLMSQMIDERVAAIGILVRCMEADGNCRNVIADQVELGVVMESFTMVNDLEKFEIVRFLYELVKLNRRTSNQKLLETIKDEGTYSTMHSLLIYLQTALPDQSPIIAALLLQLDLLAEPKKMSMYREEAIDTLISCLKDSNFPNTQLLAAKAILSLQGTFSCSGKPMTRAILLKHAGMKKSYRSLMRAEQSGYVLEDPEENAEEEKAAEEWERRMAYALTSHEFGLIFEALGDGMKSRNIELPSACLVSASWLVHMLSVLPDTGLRGAARVCLLKRFISILKSSKNADDKALAMLALRSFMNDPDGMNDITFHIKDIMKTMRELKKSSALAYEILKLLSDGKESSTQDFWNHRELNHVDCSTNGEIVSIIYFKNIIFSGHSDGTIKVWSGSENILCQIQEVREHTKGITSLTVLLSGAKLYSGSLDKTVRVWAIQDGKIFCEEVHEMNDQVHNLAVANTIACFTPHGAGVKVLSWSGGSKLLNPNKNVTCVALVQGKLYCGCHDNSIQEIDLATGTLGKIQSSNKKLLGKSNPVHTLQVYDGLLYSTSTTSEGAMVKIYNASNYSHVGTLQSSVDIRSLAISMDLIYVGCKTGLIDIWSKEKLLKIGCLQTKTCSKVQCMALDADGEVLVAGTSDGRIQAWGLS